MAILRYTTAPVSYDGFGSRSLGIVAMDRGKPVRAVVISDWHLAWQEARYASGSHCCLTVDQCGRLLEVGIFSEVKTETMREQESV